MAVARRVAPDVDSYLGTEDDEVSAVAVRTRRAVSVVEDEPEVNTAVLEDEDPNEVPARSSIIQAGWASAKAAIDRQGKGFTQEFKFSDEPQLVKFTSSDPIAVFKQHWLSEKSGRKSYVCAGDKCPLCRVAGHRPDQKIAFSVLNFSTEGDPEAQVLIVGPRVAGMLEKYHLDRKVGPLDSQFWSMARTGKGPQTSHQILPVKARDIEDDWELDPDSVNRALAEGKPLDASVIREDSYADLMAVARELVD